MNGGGFSDYRVHKWLAELQEIWVGLHYADPDVSGAYASEVFGGAYTRVKVPFSEPVNRVVFNEADALFRGLPSVRITHLGLWDTHYNGNLEASIPLANPVTVLAGKSFTVVSEMIAISLP